MRATSPSGRAAYEGRVSWSGELGFGVRPPEKGQSATLPAGDLTAAPAEPVGARDEEGGVLPAREEENADS